MCHQRGEFLKLTACVTGVVFSESEESVGLIRQQCPALMRLSVQIGEQRIEPRIVQTHGVCHRNEFVQDGVTLPWFDYRDCCANFEM